MSKLNLKDPTIDRIHILFVLCLTGALWILTIYHIDSQSAYHGFTPIHYAYLKVLSEQFLTNFPSGVEHYDKSLLMQIYPFLLKWFNIPSEITLKCFIFFEYASIFILGYFLIKIILNEKNYYLSIILALLFCSSSARNMNLANFGTPFFVGQFYNFADVLRLLGIALFLKDRLCFSFIFLCLGVITHTTLGAFAIFFCLSSLFLSSFLSLNSSNNVFNISKRDLYFFISCMSFLLFWYLAVIKSNDSIRLMDSSLWLTLAKLGNYHWFPAQMGFFTFESSRFFIPFLAFMLLFIQYFPTTPSKVDKKVVLGCISIAILTLLGIVFSTFLPIPFFIKLSLHRSMDLIIYLGLVYVVKGLWDDSRSNRLIQATLALTIMILPYYQLIAPFLLVPVGIFIFLSKEKTIFSTSLIKKWLSRVILITIFSTIILNYLLYRIKIPHVQLDGWPLVIKIFVISLALIYFASRIKFSFLSKAICGFAVISSFFYQYKNFPSRQELNRNQDYLETQLWAKNHTSPHSLFMVDPTIYYGWREFSQRSSFGNVREWMHTSWLYSSSADIYEEGEKRFHLLGLNIKDYLGYTPPLQGFDHLTQDVRARLYEKDESWFRNVQDNYGINYLVLEKQYIKRTYTFDSVFQNAHFIVFKL